MTNGELREVVSFRGSYSSVSRSRTSECVLLLLFSGVSASDNNAQCDYLAVCHRCRVLDNFFIVYSKIEGCFIF